MNSADSYPPPEFSPRLSCLEKWPDYQGYGFNLHAERGKAGQFIGKVDEGSPAEAAQLRLGDKIVEVNGVNVLNQNHHQVVTLIREGGDKVDLLVVDKETEEYYRSHSLVIKGTAPNVIKCNSHRHQNGEIQENEVIKKAETVVAVESVPVSRTLRTPTPPPEPENDYNDVPDDVIPPPVIDQTDGHEEDVVVKAKTIEVHAEPTNGTDHIVATPPHTPEHTHAEPLNSDAKNEDLSFGMSAREYREMMKNKQSKEAARKNALGFKAKKDAFDQL